MRLCIQIERQVTWAMGGIVQGSKYVKEALVEREGLNKKRMKVQTQRSGGSSAVTTPLGKAPRGSEASETKDRQMFTVQVTGKKKEKKKKTYLHFAFIQFSCEFLSVKAWRFIHHLSKLKLVLVVREFIIIIVIFSLLASPSFVSFLREEFC